MCEFTKVCGCVNRVEDCMKERDMSGRGRVDQMHSREIYTSI